MSALQFVPHEKRPDITVAVQTDAASAGWIEKRGRLFQVYLADFNWLGTRCSIGAAQRFLARRWGKEFGHVE